MQVIASILQSFGIFFDCEMSKKTQKTVKVKDIESEMFDETVEDSGKVFVCRAYLSDNCY